LLRLLLGIYGLLKIYKIYFDKFKYTCRVNNNSHKWINKIIL